MLAIRSPNFTRSGNHFALPSFPPPLSTASPSTRVSINIHPPELRLQIPHACSLLLSTSYGQKQSRLENKADKDNVLKVRNNSLHYSQPLNHPLWI